MGKNKIACNECEYLFDPMSKLDKNSSYEVYMLFKLLGTKCICNKNKVFNPISGKDDRYKQLDYKVENKDGECKYYDKKK